MPWKKGTSGNPGGRPKVSGSIRAQARLNSQAAFETLLAVMRGGDKATERASAAVQVLKLAGVSFASESEEARNTAEAAAAQSLAPPPKLEEIIGTPTLPLN